MKLNSGVGVSRAVGSASATSVTLGFYRGTETAGAFILSPADGTVATAIAPDPTRWCTLHLDSVYDGRYAFTVLDSRDGGVLGGVGGGVLAGEVGKAQPSFVYQFKDWQPHVLHVSAPLGVVVQQGTGLIRLLPWADAGAGIDIWSAKADSLQQNFPFTFQDQIFWEANQGTAVNKFKTYSPDAGAADFLTYEPDLAHGVGDLGTDGHDMVWLDGKGVSGSGLYDTNSIMTASYTNDGAALVPRRLRSEVANGFGVSQFVVGCGYSVRATPFGERIVRLADGVSWMLATTANSWAWIDPIAITCDEVFTNVSYLGGPKLNVARVRLSSLGTGTPPD